MSVERTAERDAMIAQFVEEFERLMGLGLRSVRAQWDLEGHDDPLTVYANRQGTFVVEPGAKPVPAAEWLRGRT